MRHRRPHNSEDAATAASEAAQPLLRPLSCKRPPISVSQLAAIEPQGLRIPQAQLPPVGAVAVAAAVTSSGHFDGLGMAVHVEAVDEGI